MTVKNALVMKLWRVFSCPSATKEEQQSFRPSGPQLGWSQPRSPMGLPLGLPPPSPQPRTPCQTPRAISPRLSDAAAGTVSSLVPEMLLGSSGLIMNSVAAWCSQMAPWVQVLLCRHWSHPRLLLPGPQGPAPAVLGTPRQLVCCDFTSLPFLFFFPTKKTSWRFL